MTLDHRHRFISTVIAREDLASRVIRGRRSVHGLRDPFTGKETDAGGDAYTAALRTQALCPGSPRHSA
jgi:hypothetical protein